MNNERPSKKFPSNGGVSLCDGVGVVYFFPFPIHYSLYLLGVACEGSDAFNSLSPFPPLTRSPARLFITNHSSRYLLENLRFY